MGVAVEVRRSEHTAVELRCFASKSVDGAQVRRLLALALVLEGRCRGEAAAHSGMDRQTLQYWIHRYNALGIEGLKSRRSPGRSPALSAAQKAELKALVVVSPDPSDHKVARWRCVDLRAEVARRFSVEVHGHDRQVAARARVDPAATSSEPSQEERRGGSGFWRTSPAC